MPMPTIIARTLIASVIALINIALPRAAPESVIRTSPVPDAHMTSDIIAPEYLRIGIP